MVNKQSELMLIMDEYSIPEILRLVSEEVARRSKQTKDAGLQIMLDKLEIAIAKARTDYMEN